MDGIPLLLSRLGAHDPYTAEHGARVAEYADQLAAALGLPSGERAQVHAVALLHDIGKLRIPLEVLRKPDALDPAETRLMRLHPDQGRQLLDEHGLPTAASIVLQHHERIDGQGYPAGRRGQAIHLHARIVSIADVYDAMTSDRCYRRSIGHRAAATELLRVSSTQLDAELVALFLRTREQARARLRHATERRPA